MLKVAVTGPNGLIGSKVISLLQKDFTFIPLSHQDFDISDKKAVADKLNSLDFDLILHLAGYTNVEGAEKDRSQAHMLNVDGTSNIFHAIEHTEKKMIYISTDFVFDGTNPPYDEESKPNPLGYYAQTKFRGEQVVKDHAMTVRISFPYGNPYSKKPDFIMRVKHLLEEGTKLNMITDSSITPTYIDDIAFGLRHLMNNFSSEVYHLVGPQALTPYECGMAVAKHFNLDTKLIKKTTYDEYEKGKAPRPQYSEIVSIKNNFQKMRSLTEGLVSM